MSLNKQGDGKIEWTDYTWNVVDGCLHGCQWQTPRGIVQCYAKSFTDQFRSSTFMPSGFERHYFHKERLADPISLKTPSRIFIDSFSDLMGHWVPEDQIRAILDVIGKTPQHTYQLLTKNAPRLPRFQWPENVWVGVSLSPSSMNGKLLSDTMQRAMFQIALNALSEIDVTVRWVSLEPLAWDCSTFLRISLINWAVVGAASRGAEFIQPDERTLRNVLSVLDTMNVPVFFKGNLRGSRLENPWREEYPPITRPVVVQQQSLF
jgi:protein gp37